MYRIFFIVLMMLMLSSCDMVCDELVEESEIMVSGEETIVEAVTERKTEDIEARVTEGFADIS